MNAANHAFWRKLLLLGIITAGVLLLRGRAASVFASPPPAFRTPGDAASGPIINEFLASNEFGLQDEDGDASDWIELYNPGDVAIDLTGWTLTDDANHPDKWRFPARTLPPHGYLVVFASGKDRRPDAAAELHTNFKLFAGGEYLGLFAPDDLTRPADAFQPEFPQQYTDVSYGRYQKTDYRYFANPTPGAVNDESAAYQGVTQPVTFSVQRGFYHAPFTVTLASETPAAIIRYTTNGDAPTESAGEVYTGPIHINSATVLRAMAYRPGFLPAPSRTNTYIFPAQTAHQPANPAGFPSSWGLYNGQQTPADYEMDPSIVDHPDYHDNLVDDLQSLPALSIVTSRADMFGSQRGIYAYPLKKGLDWERPASIELFGKNDPGFQINAGVRIHGGNSRRPDLSAKHSFRLYFRGDYGPDHLEQAIFPGTDVTSFERLVVRANFTDSWIWGVDNALLLRDQWVRDTEEAMGKLNVHGIFVNLYVDGLYWGVYNLIERLDEHYAASYLPQYSSFDILKGDGALGAEVKEGDKIAWDAMMALADEGLATPAQYEAIQQYLDIPTFIDYMIINLYAGHHHEWPIQNWYALRPRTADGRFQFISWDSEAILHDLNENVTNIASRYTPAWLYDRLRANSEFRLQFADRVHQHFSPGGALYVNPQHPDWDPEHPENNAPAARLARRAQQIDRAIVGESARWGDWKGNRVFTRNDHWAPEVNRLLHDYFPRRSAIVLQQFRDAGLYPQVDAPVFNRPGGQVDAGFALTMTAPSGDIYFTTDGSDPRTPLTGAPAASAQRYETPVRLSQGETTVKARALAGDEWSALTQAVFTASPRFDALHITEIMYQPLDGSDYEFIELHNAGDARLDLSGVAFVDGVDFTFPAGASLDADGYGVLVKNADAFAQRYPGVSPLGEYAGKLSNSGERLLLQDPEGDVIVDMTYDDRGLWPAKADGQGHSLVIFDEWGDPGDPGNWRASHDINGSPGAADPPPLVDGVIINEILTHSDPPYEDAIELYNPLDQDFDISGWFLSDDPETPKKYRFPENTIIEAGDYVVAYEYQFNPTPGSPPSFALSSHGETVLLSAADAAGTLTGYSDSVAFGATPTNLSLGRYDTSAGFDFTLLQTPTFGVANPASVEGFRTGQGAANAAPIIGPVVINELMYHPADDGDEFIELYNLSDATVSLFDPARPENVWAFTDGVDYAFPAGTSIPAHGYLLVVRMAPDAFRVKYGIPDDVPIFGPYEGKLSNSGERVALSRPDSPDGGFVPYIDVDVMDYDDGAPWPAAPDGDGPSLARLAPGLYGNDPANWGASAAVGGSPGRRNLSNPQFWPLFLP